MYFETITQNGLGSIYGISSRDSYDIISEYNDPAEFFLKNQSSIQIML